MIDHTGLSMTDPAKSRKFYEQALAPLGYKVLMEVPTEFTGGVVVLGFGEPPKPDFWLHQGPPQTPRIHIAFRASSRAVVEEFYKAAMAAGGKDNGPTGLRPH
jgi:catechol 2,3-dioxygenase-like lactoylglutathione lyase family enzyme